MFKLFDSWPGVSKLADYKTSFPKWAPQKLAVTNPQLNAEGLDLLAKLLVYKPEERISAKSALSHAFFRDVQIVRPPFMQPVV